MTIRKRMEQWALQTFFSGHMREVGRMVDVFEDAYERGGLLVPPHKIVQQLRENGQLLDLILRTRGSTFADRFRISEADRNASIRQSRWMQRKNNNIERAVQMWVDFSIGQAVRVGSAESAIDDVLTSFWNSFRNKPVIGQSHIHERGEDALNEGELLWALWWSPVNKQVTVRMIASDQVRIVWEDDDDKMVPIWYARQTRDGEVYYPDWRATAQQLSQHPLPHGAKRADSAGGTVQINGNEEALSKVVVVWACRNRLKELGRGLPQFMNGFEWAKILEDFMGDRAAVARKAAMYTEVVKVQGGSRVVDAVKQSLQSGLATSRNEWADRNPPTAPGSDWIENEAITREWQNRDTGATTARFDGRMIGGQLSVNTGIGLHWMGFPDAIPGGLATARELMVPWSQQTARFGSWFASSLDDVARAIIMISEGNDNDARDSAESADIMIEMDVPITVSLDDFDLLMKNVRDSAEAGLMPDDSAESVMNELMRMALRKVGVKSPSGLLIEMTKRYEKGKLTNVSYKGVPYDEERDGNNRSH